LISIFKITLFVWKLQKPSRDAILVHMLNPEMILCRTALGVAVLRDSYGALPRKLKTLLQAINGRTQTRVYINSLEAFGNVEALLTMLLEDDLIEQIPSRQPAQRNAVARHTVSAWQLSAPDSLPSDSSKLSSGGQKDWVVERCLYVMADFLCAHIESHNAAQIAQVIHNLESIKSLQQLEAYMPKYRKLCHQIGASGVAHVHHIKHNLYSL
jgi:hypothetical protein